MNAPAVKTSILRTAAGEPPLGVGGLAFRDDQGEVFEHDNPRYRSAVTKIGVLELDNGTWLANPPGFRTDFPMFFPSRDDALGYAVNEVVRRAQQYMRNGPGEGTHWSEAFGNPIIDWALGLLSDDVNQGTAADAVAPSGHPDTEDSFLTKWTRVINADISDPEDVKRRIALIAISRGEAPDDREMVRALVGEGLIHATATKLMLTEEGRTFLDGITQREEASGTAREAPSTLCEREPAEPLVGATGLDVGTQSAPPHAGADASPETGVTDDTQGEPDGALNHPATTDPIVRAMVEAHKARRAFPAGHTFSMTNPIINGQMVTMGTCTCGDSFSYKWGSYERMDAAIEAHWQKFDHLPEKIDGRGQPIGAPAPKKPRRKKPTPSADVVPNDPRPEPASEVSAHLSPADAGSIQSEAAQICAGEPSEAERLDWEALWSVAWRRPIDDVVAGDMIARGLIFAIDPADRSRGYNPTQAGSDRVDALRHLFDLDETRRKLGARTTYADAKCRTCEPAPIGAPANVVTSPDDTDDLAIDWPSYDHFLEEKIVTAPLRGIEVAREALHPYLKPHCKDLVVWALRLGCSAIFASFGLHKTAMQLEWCRQLHKHCAGDGNAGATLSVVPLGVRHGFIKEALSLDMDVKFIRTNEELASYWAEDGASRTCNHFLTNYESIREGKLDPNQFTAVSLDEASVLRSYGSKTFQEFLPLFAKVPFKLVATATPSPNRYKELIHYAGFLGVMDTGLALTRWFQRNSEKAGDLTLYPHKEDEFWMWVHSWAAFLQKPSELGYSDDGYELPPLKINWHEVPTDHTKAEPERDGQGVMFRAVANSLQDAAKARRDSLATRIAKMVEIIAQDPASHRIIWHDLEAEREAIQDALPSVEYRHWGEFKDGNPYARALYDRHYSARPNRDSDLILGPGEKLLLMTADHRAVWGWRKFKDDSGQDGVCCSVFRNEGDVQSSDLIMEAMAIAWRRWPGERLYTFVDAAAVQSLNPGFCFKEAGWQICGETQGGLKILEALPGLSVPTLTPRIALSTITGSMDIDAREARLHDFEEGRTRLFGTKPILSGSGSNFQYHCHKAIYVALPGYGYKFNDFIQSLYRLQRFGQQFPVEIDIIYAEDERAGRAALEEKWALDAEMRRRMSEIIKRHGLNTLPLRDALLRTMGIKRVEIKGERFIAINNDAVKECAAWPENSVDLMVSSIPFGTQYEYSASYRDFGHTDDSAHFWGQMDFLSSELLRMLKPGRLACIHVKDRVLFGGVTGQGVPTIAPFHAEAIMHYRAHGFQYLGMITVVTDVVRENNQTYRLGWSENAKDGTKMGVGMPEYILLLRKPQSDRSKSYADVPVTKSKEDYTRARWQIDAHAFWRSSGNRHLTPEEFAQCSSADLAKLFAKTTVDRVYDFEAHVSIGEAVEITGTLPATFMAIAPGSHHPDVWHDVNRMRTLNMLQQRKGAEMHLCPLQFDIVDRLIERYSNPDDLVFDPFGGLMTVPYRALLKGRRGAATELSPSYFLDGVHYLHAAEEKLATPQLFDLAQFDAANTPPPPT